MSSNDNTKWVIAGGSSLFCIVFSIFVSIMIYNNWDELMDFWGLSDDDSSSPSPTPTPIDCKVSWSSWTPCDANICSDKGNNFEMYHYRTGEITQRAQHGGQACPDVLTEYMNITTESSDPTGYSGSNQEAASSEPAGSDSTGYSGTNQEAYSSESASDPTGYSGSNQEAYSSESALGSNQEAASSEPAGSDSTGSSGSNQEAYSSESASGTNQEAASSESASDAPYWSSFMGQIDSIPTNYYINVFGDKIKKDNKDECLNFCANDSNCVMATFYDENREYNCKIMKFDHFGNIDLLTNIDNKYWVETKPLTDQNNRTLYHYTKDYANLEVNGNVIRFDWISPTQTDSSSEPASDSPGSSGTNQEVASSESASDSAGSSGSNQEAASSESASDSPGSVICNVTACNEAFRTALNLDGNGSTENPFGVYKTLDDVVHGSMPAECAGCDERGYFYTEYNNMSYFFKYNNEQVELDINANISDLQSRQDIYDFLQSASDSPGSSPPSTGYLPECNVEACNAYMYDKVYADEFFETTPEDSTTACYQCPKRGYKDESLYTYQIYKDGSWSSVRKQGTNLYNDLKL